MNVEQCQREYHSFANLVRKLAIQISVAGMGGESQKCAELALSLSDIAADRKRELENRDHGKE